MDFKTYYTSLDRAGKENLAKQLDTSLAYLSQLAHGHRLAGAKFLARIDMASDGQVTAREMRTDLAPKRAPVRKAS